MEEIERDKAIIEASSGPGIRLRLFGSAMIELDARADRVRAAVEGNFGRVIGRDGNTLRIEVPADIAIGLNSVWREGGFSCIFAGQRTRLSHCRIIDMHGHTVVNHQMVTTAFYRYTIDLTVDTRSGKPAPGLAEITAQQTSLV
jgi:hypothetical protein